ncbi:MAG: MG2 domain-containing protein [bacterium]
MFLRAPVCPAPATADWLNGRYSPRRLLCLSALLLLSPVLFTGCSEQAEPIDPSQLAADEVGVTAISPASLDIKANHPITLTFSQPLAPAGYEPGSYLESPPATMRPEIRGLWKWAEPDQLTFVPDENYRPNTVYLLTLEPDISRERELDYKGSREFTFTAEPFKLRTARLFEERLPGLEPTYLVKATFSFNHPVHPEDFNSALTIDLEQHGSLQYEIETSGPSEHISFRTEPIAAAEHDLKVTATLAADCRAAIGGQPLGKKGTRIVTIPAIERLTIGAISPDNQQETRRVRIDFSHRVNHSDLQEALTIEPELPNLTISAEGRRIYLLGDWEYGTHYQLRIAADLASIDGLVLEREFRGSVKIIDLNPSLEILGAGNYLSLRGEQTLAVESVNVPKMTLELDRIHANNIVHFLQEWNLRSRGGYYYRHFPLQETGSNVYRRDVENADSVPNRMVVTPIPLAEVLAENSRGIFRLSVYKENDRQLSDSKLFVATDLGIVAKKSSSDLLVAVASIQDLQPLSGVEVLVLSYNNQAIASGFTDTDGTIRFADLDAEVRGEQPFVIAAVRDDDFGFLHFDDCWIPTGDLDVHGISRPEGGYQAFVYPDRGIYRPGDTMHLAWIVRDGQHQAPAEFPLLLRIHDPQGNEFLESRVTSGAGGSGEFTCEIPVWARTGSYHVALHLDERTVIGRRSVKIEDFMPDRMKVSLDLLADDMPATVVRRGETATARVTAVSLFGPPAPDRPAKAGVRYFHEQVRFEQWSDYTFGDPERGRTFPDQQLEDQTTDENGVANWTVPLPETDNYHGWIKAQIRAEVSELGGGRAIEVSGPLVYSPQDQFIGLRQVDEDDSDYSEPGQPLAFEAIFVDLDGEPLAGENATLKILRKEWRTTIRKDESGRYRYISEYDESVVEERTLDLTAGVSAISATVNSHGSYRLVVTAADRNARGSYNFYVYGWGYNPWAMSDPETVGLKLDREKYQPGETLTVSIEAPFAGLMLLTLERERLYHQEWVELEGNTASVTITVPDGLAPNVYLTATLLRPLDSLEVHAPARAFGAVPVFLDLSSSVLALEIQAPEATRPETELSIDFRLPELATGESAPVTIAVVDEGILQVTNFATPSPLDFFMQRRRLDMQTYDIWSLLLPEYEQIQRYSSPGGGAMAEALAKDGLSSRLNPLAVKRVKPLALWSGLVDGTAAWQTLTFDLPQFNGAVRVMVVGAAGPRFGAEAATVRVRDPIVLNPNLPRFLAPGDEILVPVQVYNGIDEAGGGVIPVTIDLELDGPVALAEDAPDQLTLDLAGGQEQLAYFRVHAADNIGKAVFTFTGSAAGESTRMTVEMAVRPPRPLQVLPATGVVQKNEPATVILADHWYPGTGQVTVSVSSLPVTQFGAALPYVLRYPYGCVEQITSKVFPLLYFADLARELAPDSFAEHDADYYVNSGIDYLTAMSLPDGGFNYWPSGGSGTANPWATVYATHFLVEAARNHFVVSERVLQAAIGYLGHLARSPERGWLDSWSRRSRLRTRAYALYVLALAGEPERGAMDFLKRDALADLPNASRLHLAGAYGLIGNLDTMNQLLLAQPSPPDASRSRGYTWYSPARDEAIQLDVLATVDPHHRQIPAIFERLAAHAKNGRWHNTQENGFALLAIGKLIASGASEPASGEIVVDGEVVATFSADDRDGVITRSKDWSGKSVTIRTTNDGIGYFSILEEGIPRVGGEQLVDAGLRITRSYFDEWGRAVALDQLEQGQVIVCRLGLSSEKGQVENIVISDLVPAGLEIENPRLVSRGGFDWIQKQDRKFRLQLPQEHLEIRDDRLLLFTTARSSQHTFYYGLRAVTAGTFILPPVKAEAMYDPDLRSIQDSGTVIIAPPEPVGPDHE